MALANSEVHSHEDCQQLVNALTSLSDLCLQCLLFLLTHCTHTKGSSNQKLLPFQLISSFLHVNLHQQHDGKPSQEVVVKSDPARSPVFRCERAAEFNGLKVCFCA